MYIIKLPYCFKSGKNTESKNQKVVKTKNGRLMFLSKCAVIDSKKSRFLKEQEHIGKLSSLVTKRPLSKIPIVDPLLF